MIFNARDLGSNYLVSNLILFKMDEFVFSAEEYIFEVDWECWEKTRFSLNIENGWLKKKDHNCFRYNLNISRSCILKGEHGFLAQLNTDRAFNRRSPEEIKSLKQPFSCDSFNFTKAKKEEIMFTISEQKSLPLNECDRNYFLINISPLERFHCLLIPSLYKCLTQILTKHALHLAISSVLLNGSPEQRAGFNSLCGYATVNHLHLHTYYLNNRMKLETIKVEHLIGRCYVIENYPAKGFVFQITSSEEFEDTVNDIHKLTEYFTKQEIAHNLFITRGLSFGKSTCRIETSERDCVRIYIWARTSSYGAKVLNEFNPALCELFGHLVVKTNEAYEELTEESVSNILHSITYQHYISVKEHIKEIFMK